MKLVTYSKNGQEQLAILVNNQLYNTNKLNNKLPSTMMEMLSDWEALVDIAKKENDNILSGNKEADISYDNAAILAPLPRPVSCRDGYAFRQHVAAARRNRK